MVHDASRRIVHFNVTTNPRMEWTARQLPEAFPWDSAPKYILRDNDGIYGQVFLEQLDAQGIEGVPTAPGSPWQNPFVKRLIGTVRRDCLDHVIVFGELHLIRVLQGYVAYYNESRTHILVWRRNALCHGRWSIPRLGRSRNVRWLAGFIIGMIERPRNHGFDAGWNPW